MLKIFYSLMFLCFGFTATAQETSPGTLLADHKISEVYGDQYNTLVVQDKFRRKMLVEMINERSSLVVNKLQTGDKLPLISSVELFNKYNPDLQRDAVGEGFDKENFNVLKYKIPFSSDRTLVYRIDNTDYILVVEPQKTLKK